MNNQVISVTKNFPALTGIRAIAAYLVFFHHYTAEPHNSTAYGFMDFLHQGYIGVSIFFTLSGFLIAYRYEQSFSVIGIKQYLWNRFIRIYPLYFILCVFTLFLENINDYKIWFYNLTLLKGFSRDLVFSGIGQSWSLTVEEVFYLVAPLVFYLSKKYTLGSIVLMTYLIGLILYFIGCYLHIDGMFTSLPVLITYSFFGRCFEFYVGMWLAKFVKYKELHPTCIINTGQSFTNVALILMASLMLLFSLTPEMGIFDKTGMLYHQYLLPIVSAMLFYGLITEQSYFRFILETPMFQLLGKSSYALYLVHYGFWQMKYITPLTKGVFIYNFLFYNILAIILYLFIEKPIHSALKRVKLK
jgi:peptidoglycan/LPS O-acetylase OafA/YrhL